MDWSRDRVGGNDRAPYLSELAETLDLKDGKARTIRLIGPAKRVARHWFETKPKDAGGKTGRFPKMCLAYNSDSGEFDGKCPYCEIDPKTPRIEIHQNVIDRAAQENKPGKVKPPRGSEKEKVKHHGKTMYLKSSKASESWTPVRLASFSVSPALKIKDMAEVNKRKTAEGTQVFSPDHPKYGFDIIIKYSKDREPANQYSVMKDEKTALTEEEVAYLRWSLDLEQPEKLKDAQLEAKKIAPRLVGAEAEDDDDEDEDDKPKKKKDGETKKRSADVEDEDFDEDEDDEPKSKKKKKKVDDEDDDDDDEPKSKKKRRPDPDDDDDEDDEPKKKAGKKKSSSKDWDDDDDDDDDEDAKPKKKASKKSRDDDDEDDEDEDDRPKKKKPTSKKSRDDEDDDEDEDDDKPKKKASKKKSRDDDDDDWDDEDDDDED